MKKAALILLCLAIMPIFVNAQNNLIPNTQDCSSTRPPFAFDISRAWITSTGNKILTDCTPLAGDIDGDNKTEIFAIGCSSGSCNTADMIYIFEGSTGEAIGSISEPNIAYWAWTGTSFLLFKDKDTGKGRVFISAKDGMIYLYEITSEPGVRPLTFQKLWGKVGGYTHHSGHNSPLISDLDGNGTPEFIVGDRIFDYNGNLKATMAYKGITINFDYVSLPLVADLDNDGKPEVVVGTNVYKYDGNSASLWRTCPAISNQEGCNMAADVNQDGYVDLVFHTQYGVSPGFVRVWTPATNQDLGVVVTNLSGQRSLPFVGDIDGVVTNGKKYPEICINTAGTLYAYSYTGSGFVQKWSMTHTDGSGGTILTLFDFNNDGASELVYRDETHIRIFGGNHTGTITLSNAFFSQTCGSETASELPIVVDATGDGSANIVVTGNNSGKSGYGEVMVFEGGASKWMSCPNIWNQQLYSPLYINSDMTIPSTVKPVNYTFVRQDNSTVQFYNGGPMQAPYVSEETFLPVDLSPDVFVVSGSITVTSSSVTFTTTFGNQGLAVASASTPIGYYKNTISAGNVIGNGTLGVDLYPGQTTTITKTISGLNPLPSQFYVRILDDGTSFPAAGAYSDCNLTNNTKVFGTLELFKTVDMQNDVCVDGTSIFYVDLENNTDQFGNPLTFSNISLIDSLNVDEWQFISASANNGTLGTYNTTTGKIDWQVPSLAPGETARLILTAKTKAAGTLRNMAWIETIDGTQIGKEAINAYVQVDSRHAPLPPTISPTDVRLCSSSVTLTATPPEPATSYQWYKDNVKIDGATQSTYEVTATGSYTVSYYNGTCVSQMSSAVVVNDNCIDANDDAVSTISTSTMTIDILANDILTGCTPSNVMVTLSTVKVAQNGVAGITANKLVYTPNGHGVDSLCYILRDCNSTYQDSAMVYFVVHQMPDNVGDADCFIAAPAMDWSIAEASSLGNVHIYTPAIVGDMDGNGTPEIVIGKQKDGTTSHGGNNISIFKDGGADGRVDFPLVNQYQGFAPGIMAIGRVSLSETQDTALVFVAESDGLIRAYNIDGMPIWTSSSTLSGVNAKWREDSNNSVNFGTSVALADFNGDGYAEVYAGNKIFDAATGKLLCYGGSNNKGYSTNVVITDLTMTVAANVYGNEELELIAGNQVYEVSIVSRDNPALNAMTVVRQVAPPGALDRDGLTQIIDIDNDGKLEVVVQKHNVLSTATGNHTIYVWSPDREKVLASIELPTSNAIGIPLMGDIDNDGKPEIVVITSNYSQSGTDHCNLHALKYDGSPTLSIFWKMKHSDNSGHTGITLFDFNQDGKVEMVYRDENYLRIINGSGVTDGGTNMIGSDKMLDLNLATRYSVGSRSGTGYEYPVIADIDNDGQAEILIGGSETSTGAHNAPLRIFESGNPGAAPWAPARKVWNQYAYNAVNVNEDLTIPKRPFSPTVVFPGSDGMLGNADDVRPYNAYLQQQTTLNKNGTPLWLAAEASFGGNITYTWHTHNNTLEVKVMVKNIGDAALQAPVYATAYKNAISNTNKLATGSCTTNIAPDSTRLLTIVIPDIDQKLPISSIHVRLNDNDGTYPMQEQCRDSNNTQEKPIAQVPRANNDTLSTRSNTQIVPYDILANDTYGCTLSNLSVSIIPPITANGTASIDAGKKLAYKSNNGFSKADSIYYKIQCSGSDDAAVAIAYVIIDKPVMVEVVSGKGVANENGLVTAQLRFKFMDNVTHDKPIKVTYQIAATSTGILNTDYGFSPTPYTVTIPAGQQEMLLTLTPIQNQVIQGSRDVTVTITDVVEVTP